MSVSRGILTFMESSEVLARVGKAQTRNALLAGTDLVAAATCLADLAAGLRSRLVAADGAGDRLIGAASILKPQHVHPADLGGRLDGQSVLIVSGAIAGAVGLAQDARRMRRLGATSVQVAVLDGWSDPIEGCDNIHALLGAPRDAGAGARSTTAA